ncbi:MAG: tetratricopeptide repeat protein [Candidatus Scalindua sediminis]|nr:tetratricopeptide repeat protein [Candidatus Scalindua sediminis]
MTIATISNETIQAIASLWKLVAAVGFLLAIIILRKPLQEVVMKIRNFRFKKGEAELSLETGTEEVRGEVPPTEEKKQKPSEPVQAEEPTPKEPSDLFFEMYRAFTDGKFEDADQAFERLQKAADDAVSRLRNQVMYHWLMYKHGRDANAVQKLEDLAKKKDVRETALYWVANCHEHSQSYAKAIDAYSRALSGDISQSDRSRHTVGLAKCYVTMENPEKGLQVIASALAQVTEPEAKIALYHGIADVHEKTGNSTLSEPLLYRKSFNSHPKTPQHSSMPPTRRAKQNCRAYAWSTTGL